MPTVYIPEPYFHGSDSESDSDSQNDVPLVEALHASGSDSEQIQDGGHMQDEDGSEEEYEEEEEVVQEEEEEEEEVVQEEEEEEVVQEEEEEEEEEVVEEDGQHELTEDVSEEEDGQHDLIEDVREEEVVDGSDQHDDEHEPYHWDDLELQDDEDEDDEDEEDYNEGIYGEPQDYSSLLDSLSQKWMENELDHTISQTASDALWKLAFSFIPKIMESKHLQNVTRKIPGFKHIRKKLYAEKTPKVNLKI